MEPAASLPVAESAQRAKRGQRILFADDDKDIADTLAELLELAGFEVEVAYDGRSAVAAAFATAPEIIICDLGMPGEVDGYAVARACRGKAGLSGTRLIAFSGYVTAEAHAKAREAGFDRLLPKPVQFETLQAVLHEMTAVV